MISRNFLPHFSQAKIKISTMRNLAPPGNTGAGSRRGSTAGIGTPLASPNQGRYKGLISTPGVVKFSGWKRENDIPK